MFFYGRLPFASLPRGAILTMNSIQCECVAKILKKIFSWFIKLSLALIFGGSIILASCAFTLYRIIEPQLPDIQELFDVRYQMPMSVYSKDGLLIAQFGEKKYKHVDMDAIPDQTKKAFLAAEDGRFFEHHGVDFQGLMRAAYSFALTGEKRQGGSTITMQVARNFFLSNEKTFLRKIKEILLAFKIESQLTKSQILELYFNKIYFGHHAYGVEAAAQVYYGKSVAELSLDESAMIAGLPKAPSAFNPITNPERALLRRDYVLGRMLKLGDIDEDQYEKAIAMPVTAKLHAPLIELNAPYLAEMVRNELYAQYGEEAYISGYKVYTTIDSRLQKAGDSAVKLALYEYDERHGFRGAQKRVDLKSMNDWDELLKENQQAPDLAPGLVLKSDAQTAEIYLNKTDKVTLNLDGVKWARKFISEDSVGMTPRRVDEVLKAGDILYLKRTNRGWMLAQMPEVEGALIALDPANGAILALSGGFDFNHSKFNRATQAVRQPGSGFKPFIYTAALEEGFTPASVINDAPVAFEDPASEGGFWRPQNYDNKFNGPMRLRVALAKSRNLVSIRLLHLIGVPKAIETAKRFGFSQDELPNSLSLALGSGNATPLKMAQAYAVFANGGFKIEPFLIDRIQTQEGTVLFQAEPSNVCADCETDPRRVISREVHYLINSMLQSVIREGTATKAMELGRADIAGKTGTTNEQKDAWFNGYTPSIVAVSWLGFDASKPLGDKETGGHLALPMWISFMKEALKDMPERIFPKPDSITTARIDPQTGLTTEEPSGIIEFFPPGQVPQPSQALEPMDIPEDRSTNSNKDPNGGLF